MLQFALSLVLSLIHTVRSTSEASFLVPRVLFDFGVLRVGDGRRTGAAAAAAGARVGGGLLAAGALVITGPLPLLLFLNVKLEAGVGGRLPRVVPGFTGGAEGGGWGDGYHGVVPVTIVFQRVQDVGGVRVDQVGPRLPQRVDNVVDEPNLEMKSETTVTAFIKHSEGGREGEGGEKARERRQWDS